MQALLVGIRAGTLVYWLWEETHVPKVVSSNPCAVYWMDVLLTYTHPFVVKFVVCVWKDQNKWKDGVFSKFFLKLVGIGRLVFVYFAVPKYSL